MKYRAIIFISILLTIALVSCQMSSNNKIINIHIDEMYPFELEACSAFWYQISYNDASGSIVSMKLSKGVHDFSLCVPKNTNTYIIAQVLGDYYPQGGVVTPSSMNTVHLNFNQGYLVDFLLSLEKQNSEAINILNYSKLLQTLKDMKIIYNFDKFTLARAIFNGSLVDSSIYSLNNVRVDVTQLPPGYWVSDYEDEGAFWVTSYENKNVILSLNDGIHNYLNYLEGFLCRIIVDARSNKYFITLKQLPEELK